MSASGFIWRVTGTWDEDYDPEWGYAPAQQVKHYMTEQAAMRRAATWMEGPRTRTRDWTAR